MAGEEKKKHPISQMATGKLHPIQEMNLNLNKMENRPPIKGDFRMSKDEKKGMLRIIETAQRFQPYKKKKGP